MGVPRYDKESRKTHDVGVAPCWGMVPAACGFMPKWDRWSDDVYGHVDCKECRAVLKRREELVADLRRMTG